MPRAVRYGLRPAYFIVDRRYDVTRWGQFVTERGACLRHWKGRGRDDVTNGTDHQTNFGGNEVKLNVRTAISHSKDRASRYTRYYKRLLTFVGAGKDITSTLYDEVSVGL